MNINNFYEKNHKKLIFIPLALLLISIIFLGVFYVNNGDLINRDVSLKGGISATIYKENLNFQEIESFLNSKFEDLSIRELTDFTSQKNIGIIIETSDIDEETLISALKEKIEFNEEDISITQTGARFGQSFYKDLVLAILFAFLFMAIVILIAYRTFIPSLTVVLAALTDLIVTLAIVNVIGMQISAAGIVAFLLILGYSIDTNILLTTRMIKRKESPILERMKGSMKTGLTMTTTTIVALSVAAIVSTSPVLSQMFTIIIIALIVDIFSTYFANAPILLMYAKKKNIT
ncbi:MMPL family transporter [archaeon]|nr:MMPL family transporter [archaeon]